MNESYYEDDMIHAFCDNRFCLWLFVDIDGHSKAVSFDDNFFSPMTMVEAYKDMWRPDWNMDDELPAYLENFVKWLIDNGTDPEELEGI